ncbi:hypothetical protein D3Y57_04015 (plasmid) [Sphingomonas paeninsulae]|uniref:Uncharacterized protein n=1 Tax=Sphingomonas paeninsulae TaxID=2319844 RepID=A0A494T8F9_SPHPE|nr:hypothetical protein [Sphingomonas paeninsulae]AYJ85200.1 hypothetical protein D3Y57_04015 [Sphingomonas paeninsulae]
MGSIGALRLVSTGSEDWWECVRYRTLMAAKLVTTAGEHAVIVRELSATQALLKGENLPAIGVDVIFSRRGIKVFATVSWSNGATAGLQFEAPLNDAEMATQLGAHSVVTPSIECRAYRPAVRKPVITNEELATALGWSGVSSGATLRRPCRISL